MSFAVTTISGVFYKFIPYGYFLEYIFRKGDTEVAGFSSHCIRESTVRYPGMGTMIRASWGN